jgi:aspartyl-tRNA(Asn)/glutamyl-tRNA(Gln) amidotransferase subunit C
MEHIKPGGFCDKICVMEYDKEFVKKAAKLAKLSLTDDEIDRFAPQLNEIIKYVEVLEKVDTSKVEPTSHVIADIKNRFQEVAINSQHLEIEDALKNAPKKNGRHITTEAVL